MAAAAASNDAWQQWRADVLEPALSPHRAARELVTVYELSGCLNDPRGLRPTSPGLV